MAKFCGKCGAKLDEKSGLCPNCDAQFGSSKRHLNGRRLTALLVTVALIFGCSAGIFAATYQKPATINDYTQNSENGGSSSGKDLSSSDGRASGNDDDTSNEAILSNNVQCFVENDAAEINGAIKKIEMTNLGVFIELGQGTRFEELGIGDIFLLDGSAESPFGQTYIGKISSIGISGDNITYQIETPMVDEVFDVLDINMDEVLTTADIASIETVEGVSVTPVDSLEAYFPELSMPNASAPTASTLALRQSNASVELLGNTGKIDDPLLFDIDVDLLKIFDIFDQEKAKGFVQYDFNEGERVSVHITQTGQRYHRDNCPCLFASDEKISLYNAVNEGYTPCFICVPPLLKDEKGALSADAEMKLTGKVGLESIKYKIDYKWDILSGGGLEKFSTDVKGKFITDLKLDVKTQFELGGETTTISIPISNIKLSGLKEKLLPLFFISYNGVSVNISKSPGNADIRRITSTAPLTVGFIAYLDASGKISWEATVDFGSSYTFDCSYTAIENGQWINRMESKGEPEFQLDLSTAVGGDADVHVGASVPLYIFNLNVAEIVIVQAGFEAEGKAELKHSLSKQIINGAFNGSSESSAAFSIYARFYTKWFGINIKLKTQIKAFNISKNLDYSYLWLDKTIVEWGQKQATRYNPSTMSYSAVTAEDEHAIYYKNPEGYLVSERNGYKNTLYTEEFFSICGIDESYIYLTVPEGGDYQIYRVSKTDGTNKRILDDVAIPLLMDEKYFYYVSSFDPTSIARINRTDLKESQFSHFKDNVKFMAAQDDGYYVVTSEGGAAGILAALFGGSPKCYYIGNSGELLADYGKQPTIQQYHHRDHGSYYTASWMISNGYLRSSANEMYWMSSDKSNSVRAEGISGWNPNSAGIFTTQRAADGAGKNIVLYRAADGSMVNVTNVENDQAFFTLCQSRTGTWYFFDQTVDKLILYSMSEDFSTKVAVKEFELSQMPCNLSNCGMTITDNCIYFYTMPSDESCTVLYRYIVGSGSSKRSVGFSRGGGFR